MKRVLSVLSLMMVLFIGGFNVQAATQALTVQQNDMTQINSFVAQDEGMQTGGDAEASESEGSASFTQELKRRFIEGGPAFMGIILLCLILGLAVAIERIIFLNMSTTNTRKLAQKVEDALNTGGIEEAKEVCRNTRGPVASIYYQGLDRTDEGLEAAEKAVVSYGGVQMGQMEKNVSWIALFIALAPMLGFMGTVIGMIEAFDRIEAAGDMQPSLVAGGIKIALLTTVFGLIVAVILQVFYNYVIAKIDSIVNDMEDASITLMDIIFDYNKREINK
ncbi:MAG TPA: MotA/TolQ/ExbB proton channel family protein [Flavobacteriaceae bacterium]|nr:MotA/TolQ/ExbB proton channel family protein [Flavobacteriaceae bacterium]